MDKYFLAQFALGPVLFILCFLFYRFPPKKINYIYGFRTSRSMRSQEAWDCANRYSSVALIIVSVLTCVVQLITYALLDGKDSIIWSSVFLVVGLVAVIPLTEIHLKRQGF